VAERELIALVRDRIPHDGFILGPGDDAAVLEAGRVAWSTDLAIEGVHFTRRTGASPADAAVKALNRNLSDLAAMGAEPLAFLLAVGLPAADAAGVEAMADALAEVCVRNDLRIAGGDLSGSETLMFAISILGRVEEPLTRSGARAGDVLAITGALGEAAAGLFADRLPGSSVTSAMRERNGRGCARVREGLALRPFATSAIDISDGTAIDVGRVAEASGVRIVLDPAKLPRGHGVARASEILERDLALNGGDDYELAITLEPDQVDLARAAISPTPLTVVGVCVDGTGVTDPEGNPLEGGHEHLA
jgi:thiamine-monophosphate kinase